MFFPSFVADIFFFSTYGHRNPHYRVEGAQNNLSVSDKILTLASLSSARGNLGNAVGRPPLGNICRRTVYPARDRARREKRALAVRPGAALAQSPSACGPAVRARQVPSCAKPNHECNMQESEEVTYSQHAELLFSLLSGNESAKDSANFASFVFPRGAKKSMYIAMEPDSAQAHRTRTRKNLRRETKNALLWRCLLCLRQPLAIVPGLYWASHVLTFLRVPL